MRIIKDVRVHGVILLLFLSLSFFGTKQGITDIYKLPITFFFVAYVSAVLYLYLKKKCIDPFITYTLLTGYGVRLLLVYIDIYMRKYITLFESGADSENFYMYAQEWYYNGTAGYYTYYPKLLSFFMSVFGDNRYLLQYINVLIWILMEIIVYFYLRSINIHQRILRFTILFLSFYPMGLCLSSILLRESIIISFVTIAYILAFWWIYNGKIYLLGISCILIFLAAILHPANGIVIVPIILIVFFWNPSKQRWQFGVKAIFMLLLMIVSVVYIYNSPTLGRSFRQYGGVLLHYDLLDYLNGRMIGLNGRTEYLTDMTINNYFELFIACCIRSVYFLFSPLPWTWSSVQLMVAFILDGLFVLCFIFLQIIKIRCKGHRLERLLGAIGIILFVVVYAFGTSNAGTAIRHRNVIMPLMLIVTVLSLNKEEKNEA